MFRLRRGEKGETGTRSRWTRTRTRASPEVVAEEGTGQGRRTTTTRRSERSDLDWGGGVRANRKEKNGFKECSEKIARESFVDLQSSHRRGVTFISRCRTQRHRSFLRELGFFSDSSEKRWPPNSGKMAPLPIRKMKKSMPLQTGAQKIGGLALGGSAPGLFSARRRRGNLGLCRPSTGMAEEEGFQMIFSENSRSSFIPSPLPLSLSQVSSVIAVMDVDYDMFRSSL